MVPKLSKFLSCVFGKQLILLILKFQTKKSQPLTRRREYKVVTWRGLGRATECSAARAARFARVQSQVVASVRRVRHQRAGRRLAQPAAAAAAGGRARGTSQYQPSNTAITKLYNSQSYTIGHPHLFYKNNIELGIQKLYACVDNRFTDYSRVTR